MRFINPSTIVIVLLFVCNFLMKIITKSKKTLQKILILWFFNDKHLVESEELRLVDASQSDSGTYTCQANTNLSTMVLLFIVICLQFFNENYHKKQENTSKNSHFFPDIEKPTIAIYPASTQLTPYIEGMTINLKCSANGNPVPTFLWFFNDKRLVESEELRLVDVSPSDSGRYTCHTNTNPSTIVTVSVDIKGIISHTACILLLKMREQVQSYP